jgi:hypothetical protein
VLDTVEERSVQGLCLVMALSRMINQPLFSNLHSDPRWLPFLESIGRSPEQLAAIEFEVTLPRVGDPRRPAK